MHPTKEVMVIDEQENPGGTQPPDDQEIDPDAGSPVPDEDKEENVPGPDADDTLPAPTPGM